MTQRRCLLLSALVGCAPAAAPIGAPALPRPAPSATPVAAAAPTASVPRYAALFDDLVRQIERDHTFPPKYAEYVGHPWTDDVPRLRAEFGAAKNRDEALAALRHLQNSLRDVHCDLSPPADLHERWLRLGLRIWSGGSAAAPDVRVSEVLDPDVKGELSTGDAIVAVDGTALADWFAAHPFEANVLSPRPALADAASAIVFAVNPWSQVKEGDGRVLRVMHDGAPRDVTMHFRRGFPEVDGPDLDHPPPMSKVDCNAVAPPGYGDDYTLDAMGVNVCVYKRRHAARGGVAIVRFVSFWYGGMDNAQSLRMVRVDHDVLASALRDASGVVLDVHENGGGNNPFIFLGWFSGGPWDHERVVTRVVPGLDTASVADLFWGDEKNVSAYADAQKAGKATIETRFLCTAGNCVGETSPESERVTRAPVALVVGPGCVSSCDTLALTWSAFHLGPVVGMQPMHAYTVNRLPIHVRGPDSEDLGTLRIALSESELKDGVTLEGEPLTLAWEAPDTFETRKTWVKDAIEHASTEVRTHGRIVASRP